MYNKQINHKIIINNKINKELLMIDNNKVFQDNNQLNNKINHKLRL